MPNNDDEYPGCVALDEAARDRAADAALANWRQDNQPADKER